jgi:hypothetical protein
MANEVTAVAARTSAFARGAVLAIPGQRGLHQVVEGRLRVDLVVAEALEHHEFLGLTRPRVELKRLLRGNEAVVVGGDE